MSRKLAILIVACIFILAIVVLFNSNILNNQFLTNLKTNSGWFLPVLIMAALADSINPCAISVLLITIAFLISLGKNKSGILKIGGIYILGVFIVYILIGLGVLQALSAFNTPHFVAKVAAYILILVGIINIINDFFPKFPIKLQIPQSAHGIMAKLMEKGSLVASFLLGVAVGAFEFPCTGGPYLLILGLLHDRGTYLSGLGYLIFYNIIFVLPLIIILLIASDESFLARVQGWRDRNIGKMRLFGGLAMIALGVLILLIQ